MDKSKGMSLDMFNFIKDNITSLQYDLKNGKVTTAKGTNGTICSTTGYLRAKVNKKLLQVHQILAVIYFDEDCIGKQVNHIDGNKLNNRRENLELVTRRENIQHAWRTGLYKDNVEKTKPKISGENNALSKLTEENVRFIRSNPDLTTAYFSKLFNVDWTTVNYARIYKTWKHVI